MGIALLGYGSIARSHMLAIQSLRDGPIGRDLRLRSVMGRVAESAAEFAQEYGFDRSTTDLDEVLNDPEVDVVIVTSPSELHAEQTERALTAGKHVLCEIPLAMSLADTDRLIQVADAAGRSLMVCHTERFYPTLNEVKRRVVAGELHPHAIHARFMFDRRENVNWMGRRRSWTDNLLWHHACHSVDSALWLTGAAELEVLAQLALPGGNLEIPMDLVLAMRTPRDQVISLSMSYNTKFPMHDYLFIGEETTLHYLGGALIDRAGIVVAAPEGSEVDFGVALQDREFFLALLEQREPSVSARAVRPAMAALQAAQDSLDARARDLGPDARHPGLP